MMVILAIAVIALAGVTIGLLVEPWIPWRDIDWERHLEEFDRGWSSIRNEVDR